MKNEKIFIETMIARYSLKGKSRRREKVYKRFYLMSELRRLNMPITKIGKMFNRHHASVLHGIKMHQNWDKQGDEYYIYAIQELKEQMYLKGYVPKIRVQAVQHVNDVKLSIFLPMTNEIMSKISTLMTADEVYDLLKT